MPTPAENTPATAAPGDAAPTEDVEGAPTPEPGSEGGEPAPEGEGDPKAAAGDDPEAEAEKGEKRPETPADWAKFLANVPEVELKRLGERFANRTMAASRRAQRETQAVQEENARLKREIEQGRGRPSLRSNPSAALAAEGFTTVRDFVDFLVAKGADKQPTADERLAAFEERERQREEREQRAAHDRRVEESKAKVGEAIKGDAERWPLTGSKLGQSRLWDEISNYLDTFGHCPDDKVFALADEVEKELRSDLGERVPGRGQPAKAPTTPAASAAPAGKNSGKTLTNRGTSGAPTVTELSMDPDERRRQVNEQMRAEGLL